MDALLALVLPRHRRPVRLRRRQRMGGQSLSDEGGVNHSSCRRCFPLSPCGRGCLRQRVGAKRRPMINSAKTGEGLSPRIETPHPTRTSSAPPSPTRGEGRKGGREEGRKGGREE